jgi:hypothetical protein
MAELLAYRATVERLSKLSIAEAWLMGPDIEFHTVPTFAVRARCVGVSKLGTAEAKQEVPVCIGSSVKTRVGNVVVDLSGGK